jgi:hypothetical protein
MSVSVAYAPVREAGNGTKVAFTFTFKIFNKTDLVVSKLVRATNAETLMTVDTDYTVTINPTTEGGTVTYAVAPTALQDSYIRRTMTLTQPADIPTNNLFREVQIENALDKNVMIDQQQQVLIDRSVKLPEVTTGVSVVLPVPVSKKALRWNNTATALINSTDNFDDIITNAVAAKDAAVIAQTAAELAETHAETAETNAETAETNAETAQTGAQTAQGLAETAQTAAELAETHAETAETNAETAETNAETAQGLAETARNAAQTAQGLAETAETNAETAETNAETAQGLAEDAKDAADADVVLTHADVVLTHADVVLTHADVITAAAQAAALKGTSTTSLAIATGSKTFVTQAGKQFAAGQFVLIVSDANSANWMHGQVTSYSTTSLVVNVITVGGSGTLADWTITVSGIKGATGATGPTGSIPIATAAGAADAITADYTPDLTLTDLVLCAFIATAANATTTPTFAPDGLTAHTIVKKGGSALVAGDIPGAGAVCIVEYNLAGTRWELLNPASGMQYGDARTKVVNFTIDLSTTGTQAVTGLGFQPKALFFMGAYATASAALQFTMCLYDAGAGGRIWDPAGGATDAFASDNTSGFMGRTGAGDYNEVNVTSLDSGGFTLTKNKTGSPTGTFNMQCIAFR